MLNEKELNEKNIRQSMRRVWWCAGGVGVHAKICITVERLT